jgi:hypothetical protein
MAAPAPAPALAPPVPPALPGGVYWNRPLQVRLGQAREEAAQVVAQADVVLGACRAYCGAGLYDVVCVLHPVECATSSGARLLVEELAARVGVAQDDALSTTALARIPINALRHGLEALEPIMLAPTMIGCVFCFVFLSWRFISLLREARGRPLRLFRRCSHPARLPIPAHYIKTHPTKPRPNQPTGRSARFPTSASSCRCCAARGGP